ncbi:hypothetical protein [Lysinibacillus fusiformis]|uniref:hypothetical protein n=1 Tax=Lysinibacillus fusiformis TaxID=28031 RepID=UPI0018E5DC4B|nr:hypothetical protein [Lysinibacillus fusiformis]MBI6862175.1 hypothetical protein [Lysinibacillus fusiformis]
MPHFQPNYRRGVYPSNNMGTFGPPFRGRAMQPNYQPNRQFQGPGLGRLPDHLHAIMGHAGTITNGVNMLRQMGALLSLFK